MFFAFISTICLCKQPEIDQHWSLVLHFINKDVVWWTLVLCLVLKGSVCLKLSFNGDT